VNNILLTNEKYNKYYSVLCSLNSFASVCSPVFSYIPKLIDDGELSICNLNKYFCRDDIGYQQISYCWPSSKESVGLD
jgi:hypothetical protein